MRALARPLAIAVLALGTPVALAQEKVEKTLALEAGGRFELETVGSATITGSDRSGAAVTITYSGDLKADYEVAFTETPGLARVTIRQKDRGAWGWFSHGTRHSPRVTVALPAKAQVEASTAGGGVIAENLLAGAQLASAGGSVEARNVAGGLEAESSGGSVRVARSAGSVRAESAGGGVDLQDISGDALVSSAGGSVRLERVTGKIKASASGGGVDVVLSPGNASGGSIESAGGGIRVSVDPAVSLSLTASAAGGSVQADLPIRMKGEASRSELQGDLGQGGPLLKLEAAGGGIRIEALPTR